MPRNPNWGGARPNRSALARPTVRHVELDEDVAVMIRNGCIIRHGTATKADVTDYVNSLLRQALRSKTMDEIEQQDVVERCEYCGTVVTAANHGRTVDRPGAYVGVICAECAEAEDNEVRD